MSIRPTSAQKPWLWPVLLVAVALAALGYLAVRGIASGQETMMANLRAELARQIPSFLDTASREPPQGVLVYPIVLGPVPGHEDWETFRKAMDAGLKEREEMLRGISESNAMTPSGVPLAPLVMLELCRLAPDRQELKGRISTLLRCVVVLKPSVITPRIFKEAELLLEERGIVTDTVPGWTKWCSKWEANEKLRSHVRELDASFDGPFSEGWLPKFGDQLYQQAWLTKSAEGISAISALELARKCSWPVLHSLESYEALGVRADIRFHDWPLQPVSGAGERLASGPSATGSAFTVPDQRLESLARGARGGISINLVLADPAAFRAEYWRQASTIIVVVAAAFLAVALGLAAMLRSLARERRLGEMKSNFVSSVSHELRAPVASMQLMAENLDTGAVVDESRKREYHRLIADECRRLGALIENVLDFARIEQGRKSYRFAETDAAALVRHAVGLMMPRAEARKQQIEIACQTIEPVCDGLAVQQALVNLLDNAVKFSPERTTISVVMRGAYGHRWEISVSDKGPGVPVAERERIFERFYRAGSELTRETQGTGIGLSIVKHIVEAHGGRIEVADADGGGAKFTMVLPMKPRT